MCTIVTYTSFILILTLISYNLHCYITHDRTLPSVITRGMITKDAPVRKTSSAFSLVYCTIKWVAPFERPDCWLYCVVGLWLTKWSHVGSALGGVSGRMRLDRTNGSLIRWHSLTHLQVPDLRQQIGSPLRKLFLPYYRSTLLEMVNSLQEADTSDVGTSLAGSSLQSLSQLKEL
jgi:hypothetical protein